MSGHRRSRGGFATLIFQVSIKTQIVDEKAFSFLDRSWSIARVRGTLGTAVPIMDYCDEKMRILQHMNLCARVRPDKLRVFADVDRWERVSVPKCFPVGQARTVHPRSLAGWVQVFPRPRLIWRVKEYPVQAADIRSGIQQLFELVT